MTNTKRRILALFLVLTMTCSLFPLPTVALESDNTLEPEIAVEEVIFDISKGSVIAGADGITGVTGDGSGTTTVPWAEMAGHDFVVTGTAIETTGYHIEVAADCPQNVELTLRGVSITTMDNSASQYSAICNKSADKELTLNLEGANSLKAETWRLLWNEGGVIRFVGRGDNPSLDLNIAPGTVSLMRSVNGTFAFESCAVTMNRAVGADNQVASNGTTVEISSGATITDINGVTLSEKNVGEIVHDLSTATADVEIGNEEAYRKEYTYGANKWTLIYPNVKPLHIVTGTVENANYRVTVTSPEANILLKNLSLNMNGTGSRSAFLVKYADPADYGKQLTVKVSGNVSLTASTASTFNTYDVDNSDPVKQTQPENVLVVGDPTDGDDTLTITRTGDTGEVSAKAAVNVNLTAVNLKVVVQKNCNFNVTAEMGSVVNVGGYIGGEAIEKNGGQLLDSNFYYQFIADGHAFVPVADKSNGNMPTLLLPGSANLSNVTLTVTPGWTVDGYTTDANGNTSLDFTGNDTLNLTVTPSDEIIALGGTIQTITVRAMKGSNISSLYLTIGEDSENTMVQVDADYYHETEATGNATLLNANEGDSVTDLAMKIKGRGNASWHRAKKGYQISLDSKKNVLDMGTAKKWVLLPSAVDHALIRNAVGLDLAEQLGLDFTSKWRFVDFYVDGEYYGLYILCEKAEVGTNRIDITDLDDVLEGAIGKDNFLSEQTGVTYSDEYKTSTVNGTEIDLTGGYHLEFDNYIDPMQFSAGNILQISVKEPECLGANPKTDVSFTYIRNFMAAADAAILDTTSDDFLNYIDIESFAQMWLLLEAIYAGDATDNMHIWKESDVTGDGKIHAGPAWDYDRIMARDLKFGSDVVAEANKVRIDENNANLPQRRDTADYNAYWIIRLMKHPEFKAEIKRQYELNKELFTNCATCNCVNATNISEMEVCDNCVACYVHVFTAKQEDLIRDSLALDLVRWYGYKFNDTNQVGDGSLTAESREVSISNMKQFACVRNDYLANRIAPWEAGLFTVTFINGGQVVATKQVGSGGVSSLPTAENGCQTLMGWFYTDGGQEVEFTTGTPVTKNLTVIAKWSDLVLTLNEATAATCVETGYAAHYPCTKCGKLFSDAAHKNEITADSIVTLIDPNNHVRTEIRNAKEATEESAGYTGDTWCLDCHTMVSKGSVIEYNLTVFDIGKGSVIAGVDGITGVTGDGSGITVPWTDMASHDFAVTGTADATTGYHIEVAADCPQNVELTLRGVSITTNTPSQYSAICNKSANKELTLNLEGAISLKAEQWRLLWNEGGVIRFVGRGETPSLDLTVMQDAISLMRSVNGIFAFESCAVTLNRAVGADNLVASDGTRVEISNGATITDSNSMIFSEANVGEIVHDLSTATADVEIGKAEIYRKDYTYTDTSNVKHMWTLAYPNVTPLHIVTGTVENANYRVTVTSPGANILLRDLTLNMNATGSRSAFLVKYADPADYGKQLTVKVSGNVSLTAGTASTFNTVDVDNADPAKRTQPENVLVVGDPTDGPDKLTITRTDDTSGVNAKAAVNVNLTAANLKVVVQKNCNFNVTAEMGSVVIVGGYIGGEAIEKNGGQLLDSNFHYEFIADGYAFVPVADKSNGNISTLLLPGSVNLSNVTLTVTPGWTVDGYTTDANGNTSLDFTGNDKLNLTVTPSDEIIALGGKIQTITVRAMKSSDIPAVCLNLTEGTMSAVNGDPDHETTAKGNLSILNDKSGGTILLNIAGTEIKGRGNASWNRAKKSYQIKLDAKADVLVMGNSKKWILLPGAADLSMMRSAVGFELAQKLGMEFAANWEFVDFYVNGEYYGLYILCEKAEVGTNRIGITNLDDVLEEAIGKDNILSEQTGVTYSGDHKTATVNGIEIDLTGGYHLEFDNYDDPLQFAAGGIQRITVKEPECLGTNPKTDESFTYIRNFMAAADVAVLDTTSDDFLNYIDIESFAQMWLLKQYMDDYDAVRNMHIWKESDFSGDGLIHAGPAWDFDNSMCRDTYDVTTAINNAKSHTYFNESGNAVWLKKLENHPAFQAEVVKQYQLHSELFTSCDNCAPNACGNCYIHNFVALQAEKTASASVMDTVRWYGTTFSNKPVSTENRTTSLLVVEAFACARNGYLKGRIESWGTVHIHQWNEGEVTQQATCTENGIKTFSCEGCGNTKTEVITATGHSGGTAVKEKEVPATCKAEGSYDEVIYCTICGEEISRTAKTIEKLAHTSGEAVRENEVPATCKADGSYDEVIYCIICGEEISRTAKTIEKLAHTYGTAVKEKEVPATCKAEGSYDEVIYCTICGEEISRTAKTIEKLAHTSGEAVRENEVPATCKADGSYDEVIYCIICGEEISRTAKTIEKLVHTYGTAVKENEVPATCKAEGSYDEVIYCTICGEEISRTGKTIEKLTHTPGTAVKENEVPATCQAEGSYDEVIYCTICEEEISRTGKTIEKLTHTPGEAVLEKEVPATCQAEGSYDEVIYCTICEEEISRTGKTIEKLAHTPGEAVRENEVPATCKAEGSYDEVIYCTICVEEISRTGKTIEKLAHNPGEAVREKEVPATCQAEGSYDEVIYCTICEEEISRMGKTIEKLTHTPGEAVREKEDPATCKAEGSYDEVIYCTICDEEISRTGKTIEKLTHTPGEAVREKEVPATCQAEGSYDEVIYCTICEEEISRTGKTIEKLAHNPGEWIIDKPATNSSTGSKHKKCMICHETIETASIPATGGESSGGGGSYTPLIYPVTDSNQGIQVGGQTKLSKDHAEAGDTVIITATPKKGYESGKPIVLDSNKKPISVMDNGDGTFSFKMPAGEVTVETEFAKIDFFDDVNKDDWFDEASWYCAAHGLIQGTGSRQFDGHMGTNRAMLVTVLYRLANSTDSLESIFDDVESGKWYSDAIGWAVHNKIVEGYGNGKFGPDDALTREQMVSVLYRYSVYMKYDVSKLNGLDTFNDKNAISDWALPAMKWAVGNGIVEGVGNDLVSPGTGATRAQFAAMMQRYATTFVK